MRLPLLAIILALAGVSGSLQASKPGTNAVHKVRNGETAGKIARDYGISLTQLGALNPKINLARLSIGMSLKVAWQARKHGTAPKATILPALPDIAEARPLPLAPIRALPIISTVGSAVLVHLERILPATLHTSVPGISTSSGPTQSGTPSSMAIDIRPILPPSDGLDPTLVMASVQAFEPADPLHLDLLWPVETRTVSSAWGPRIRSHVVAAKKGSKRKRVRIRYRGSHKGIDLTAPKGTNIYATLDGDVITAARHRLYGNYVVLDHGNGVVTLYAHQTRIFVQEGEIVRRGQKIGEVGRTGNATGPHLHFELRIDGVHQNPLPVLNDTEEIPADLMAMNDAALPPFRRR